MPRSDPPLFPSQAFRVDRLAPPLFSAFVADVCSAAGPPQRTGRSGLRGAWRRPHWDMPIDRSVPLNQEGHDSMMVIGIDAHKRSHTAVMVDGNGRERSTKTVGTTTQDHLRLRAT